MPKTQATFEEWLNSNYTRFETLTKSVVAILTSLITDAGVTYLSIGGRTKDLNTCLEKLSRKSYDEPSKQMTDLSGIRVIVYFEHDVAKVSSIIEKAFDVDLENSMNRDDLMSVDQVGYRSVHFVCGLGETRSKLLEFKNLKDLKCEIQVRTVLQHAWAELAHDRNYKFSGKLPKGLERKLYLLAGLVESADNGFSELSKDVDNYILDFERRADKGDFNIDLNSISLKEFIASYAQKNKEIIPLKQVLQK